MQLREIRPGLLGAEHAYRPLRVIGAGLALFGVFMVGAGLGWWPANNDPFDLIVGGVLMGLFGLGVATYRQGFRLELRRRIAVRIWRSLGIVFSKSYDLDRAVGLTLAARTVRSRRSATTAWFLELRDEQGEPFELTRFVDEDLARRVARAVAAALDLPLG